MCKHAAACPAAEKAFLTSADVILNGLLGNIGDLMDEQRDQSPGEREPEHPRERMPGGIGTSVREAYRSAHSQRSRALTVHAPLPNKQHIECVYPQLLNNDGRDEHTS